MMSWKCHLWIGILRVLIMTYDNNAAPSALRAFIIYICVTIVFKRVWEDLEFSKCIGVLSGRGVFLSFEMLRDFASSRQPLPLTSSSRIQPHTIIDSKWKYDANWQPEQGVQQTSCRWFETPWRMIYGTVWCFVCDMWRIRARFHRVTICRSDIRLIIYIFKYDSSSADRCVLTETV